VNLRHAGNLFHERCRLHKQHIRDIDHRHSQILERLFLAKINSAPDSVRRLSNLENQLLQLESQRRDAELAFWKDTVELRDKLFEGAGAYKAAEHNYSVFAGVE